MLTSVRLKTRYPHSTIATYWPHSFELETTTKLVCWEFSMPYFKLREVAQRLDANESWLKHRINTDRRSAQPQLQFHHYVGTSPVWTLDAFEALRKAIAAEIRERRRYKGTGRPTKGWAHRSRISRKEPVSNSPIGIVAPRNETPGEAEAPTDGEGVD